MIKHFFQEGQKFTIEIQKQGDGFFTGISEEGKQDTSLPLEELRITGKDSFVLRTAHGESHGRFLFAGGDVYLHLKGRTFRFKEPSPADLASSGQAVHKSPMPGKVIAVQVAVGDSVQKDQTIVIVEAMKMENAIKARVAGQVKAVHCRPGDLVSPDLNLVEIEGS